MNKKRLVAAIPFEVAYPAIAWLCWVPNLLVAELALRRKVSLRHLTPFAAT